MLNDLRPDDTFFDLANGKDVVNALLADIGSAAIADFNKASLQIDMFKSPKQKQASREIWKNFLSHTWQRMAHLQDG